MREMIDYYRLVAHDRRDGVLPLVPHQLTMMAYRPGQHRNTGYTIGHGEVVQGQFDPAAMRRACAQLLDDHAALRGTIDLDGRRPVQRIAATVDVDDAFCCLDLDGVSIEEASGILADRVQSIDATSTPQLRVAVGRVGAGLHVIWVAAQHFFIDTEAYVALTIRLWSHYEHLAGLGSEPPFEPPSESYESYVRGLARRFRNPVVVGPHRQYWRSLDAALAEAGGMTAIPHDLHVDDPSGRRSEWLHEWSSAATERLRRASRALGVSPTSLLWCGVRSGLRTVVPLDAPFSAAVLTTSSGHAEAVRDPVSLRLGDAIALFPPLPVTAGDDPLAEDVVRAADHILFLTQRHSRVPGSLVTRELPDDLAAGWATMKPQMASGHKLMLNVTDERRSTVGGAPTALPVISEAGEFLAARPRASYSREIVGSVDRAQYQLPIIKVRIAHYEDRIETGFDYDAARYSGAMFSAIGDGLVAAVERVIGVSVA